MLRHKQQHHVLTLATLAMIAGSVLAAEAQEPSGRNAERITVTARIDVLNAYSFRGMRQDDTGLIAWPQVNIGVLLFTGDGTLNRLTLHAGSWNSVHSGVAGADGPSGRRWYESDIRTGLELAMKRGVIIGAGYTAYTSPNEMFTTVKELSLSLALDGPRLGAVGLRPYALVAFELDTEPGVGQSDGGLEAGQYLELGAVPTYTAGATAIEIPVKVGLSLDRYYELVGRDRRFGYVSAAGILSVPLGARTPLGEWTLRGGVEYQLLGAMTKALNDGNDSLVIGSLGVGWSR